MMMVNDEDRWVLSLVKVWVGVYKGDWAGLGWAGLGWARSFDFTQSSRDSTPPPGSESKRRCALRINPSHPGSSHIISR